MISDFGKPTPQMLSAIKGGTQLAQLNSYNPVKSAPQMKRLTLKISLITVRVLLIKSTMKNRLKKGQKLVEIQTKICKRLAKNRIFDFC